MPELPERIIDGLLHTDPENHVAIGARVLKADGTIAPEIIGVARYHRRTESEGSAEPSVVVADDLQGHGLGRLLLRMITRYARAHHVTQFRAHTLAENERVRHIMDTAKAVSWSAMVRSSRTTSKFRREEL